MRDLLGLDADLNWRRDFMGNWNWISVNKSSLFAINLAGIVSSLPFPERHIWEANFIYSGYVWNWHVFEKKL